MKEKRKTDSVQDNINANEITGGVTAPRGFKSSGISCGLKKSGKKDLALVYSGKTAAAAGVFTTNDVKAAPVLVSQERLSDGRASAVIINSGNANACTGEQGHEDARRMTELTAGELKVDDEDVLVASTGIIGEMLSFSRIEKGIPRLVAELQDCGQRAAEAIMTTDTCPKQIALEMKLPSRGYRIKLGGMAKGSGMLQPNMATMIAVFTTDVAIKPELLSSALREVVDVSFNRISVDWDQSTNDCVFLLANGGAAVQGDEISEDDISTDDISEQKIITAKDEDYEAFILLLKKAARFLARELAADGEGATKLITIEVDGALSQKQAELVARQIANSSLVKTACFGEDPNWGRILAAAGARNSGIEPQKVEIIINGKRLFACGQPLVEGREELEGLLADDEIKINVDLNLGDSSLKFWTSDISYEYIKINAEYHT